MFILMSYCRSYGVVFIIPALFWRKCGDIVLVPSVRLSVRPSICPSVRLSVRWILSVELLAHIMLKLSNSYIVLFLTICRCAIRFWILAPTPQSCMSDHISFLVKVCTALTSGPRLLIFGMWLHICVYIPIPCSVDGPNPSVKHEWLH